MKLIHEDAAVRLHHGNALETPIDVQADGFMIDPPWARTGGAHCSTSFSADSKEYQSQQSDQFWLYWFRDVARRTTAATKPTGHGFVFCDEDTYPLIRQGFAGTRWNVTQVLVWDRDAMGLGSPFRAAHESIAFVRGPAFKWTGSRSLRDVIKCRWPYGEHENHGSEKPVELLSRLMVEYSDIPAGGLWLDNFGGSMSVAVAGAKCGRRVWSCEDSEEQAAKGVERYRADVAQVELAAIGTPGKLAEPAGPLFAAQVSK